MVTLHPGFPEGRDEPPLRERRGDIAALAERWLAGIAPKLGRGPLALAPEAVRWLEEAPWPGNVRELANVLERAAILTDGPIIRAGTLAATPPVRARTGAARGITLEEIEQNAIADALAAAGGNRRVAAESLGIGLRTLYDKLKRNRADASEVD